MKKGLFVLVLVAVALAVPVAAFANDLWYGDPDPFECAEFDDCYWTTLVCKDGVTYEVGVYFDPAEATSDDIAAATEYYLTPRGFTWGACQKAEPVITGLWAYVNRGAEPEDGGRNICYILSLTQPTQSEADNDVKRLCFTTEHPNWWDGAEVLTHGDVYENGTDWGDWGGDAVANAFNPNAKRLPLHAPAGEKDLFDVVEIAPWTQGE